jgi:hypothetical protein
MKRGNGKKLSGAGKKRSARWSNILNFCNQGKGTERLQIFLLTFGVLGRFDGLESQKFEALKRNRSDLYLS